MTTGSPARASHPTRRTVIRGFAGLAGASALATLASAPRPVGGGTRDTIVQAAKADPDHFMQRALELRRQAQDRGDQPYGAVVVKEGRIVGEGASGVVVHRDPTAHAEMEAIRDACRRLGTNDLTGCEIYATSPPCRMCETACYWARISRMYVGSPITDGGAPRYATC